MIHNHNNMLCAPPLVLDMWEHMVANNASASNVLSLSSIQWLIHDNGIIRLMCHPPCSPIDPRPHHISMWWFRSLSMAFSARRLVIYFNKQSIPYGLVEEDVFRDLRLNVGLTEKDFHSDNSEYHYYWAWNDEYHNRSSNNILAGGINCKGPIWTYPLWVKR